MRRSAFSLIAVSAAIVAVWAGSTASPEIDNVAAFARLYGVVRYFYPSDAAAELSWNRFAVHGVAQVRGAANAGALRDTLRALFAPLGPGIEVAVDLPEPPTPAGRGEPLVAWRYLGAGFDPRGPYRAKRTGREAPTPGGGGFVTLMQVVPAEEMRGKTIRLRAQVRALLSRPPAGAALWLRVDRPGQVMGFFDNMSDRLVRAPQWREYTIEGPIAEDAEGVAFGVMAVGGATAEFDSVALAVQDSTGDWTPVSVADAGFEASMDEAGAAGWLRTGPGEASISRPTEEAPDGRRHLRIAPPAPGSPDEELFDGAPPTPGAHVDFALGSGLRARVPLVLEDREATAALAGLDHLAAALETVPETDDALGVDRRLADVVVAWNVFRHFYPYWEEAGVDWDARLRPQLELAAAADTRGAQRNALRRLAADARDGHAGVNDTLPKGGPAHLPVALTVIDDRIVVTTSAVPEKAQVGAVVDSIDGEPAGDWLTREMSLASGTAQWKRVRVLWRLAGRAPEDTIRLGLAHGNGPEEVVLRRGSMPPPPEPRPEAIAELEPGIWYVDLTRSKMQAIREKLDDLAGARAVIFDMRGYPTDAGAGILGHLLPAPENDRWMHVARIVGPFGQRAGWESFGWDGKPATPHIGGRVVFLTDGRAISYAESVMGYVADLDLGTIVGSPTAGTNGNVASFTTPGSFRVRFTGMRVTRHDGTTPFHLLGVTPDVAVASTIEDIRAGRDPVLEKGLAIARATRRAP